MVNSNKEKCQASTHTSRIWPTRSPHKISRHCERSKDPATRASHSGSCHECPDSSLDHACNHPTSSTWSAHQVQMFRGECHYIKSSFEFWPVLNIESCRNLCGHISRVWWTGHLAKAPEQSSADPNKSISWQRMKGTHTLCLLQALQMAIFSHSSKFGEVLWIGQPLQLMHLIWVMHLSVGLISHLLSLSEKIKGSHYSTLKTMKEVCFGLSYMHPNHKLILCSGSKIL